MPIAHPKAIRVIRQNLAHGMSGQKFITRFTQEQRTRDQVAAIGGVLVLAATLLVLALVSAGPSGSAFSQIQTVFARASLFRPSWVGSWTFCVVFVLALGSLVAGISLLLRAARPDWRLTRKALVAIAAIAFVNSTLWAVVTPAFNTPDEASHFNYVETLARGELPVKLRAVPGVQGNSVLPSSDLAVSVTARGIAGHPDAKPPWTRAQEREFQRQYDELRDGPDAPYGLIPSKVYSPAYYAPAVVFYKLAPSDDVFDRLFMVRLWSALLVALAAAFVALFVRELLPRPAWAAPVAGLAVAFEPMVAHLGGGVSNDHLMVTACAAALWAGARLLRRGIDFWSVFGAALALVVGYAAKPTALGIAPAVVFAGVIALWRSRDRQAALRTSLLAVAAPVALFIAVFALFGTGGSVDLSETVREPFETASPWGFFSYVWQWYLPAVGPIEQYWSGVPPFSRYFFAQFLATFNALDTTFSNAFFFVAGLMALLLSALSVRMVWLRRHLLRRNWPLLAYPATAVLGTLALIHITAYLLFVQDGQPFVQGRYLFPLLGVFGLWIACGAIGAGRRLALPLASAVVVALACTNIAGMILSLGRFYL
jgi:hypothetical protein